MGKVRRPRKHRHSRNYTFMIISGDSDGRTRKFHLNHLASQILAYIVFFVSLLAICYVVYSAITIRSLRTLNATQKEQIDELTSENTSLSSSNNELQNKVQQMSAALNQHLEMEQVSAVEAETNAIPSGFPLTGTANYSKAMDNPAETTVTRLTDENRDTAKGNPILLFESDAGNNIIAAGSGTVMTVTSDVKFGNMITIDHHNGYVSIYRNSGSPLVSEGSQIDRGDALFVIGKNTTLGFQIQKDEQYISPETLIEING